MRQAQTLNEAQLRRVLHYCRSRRHLKCSVDKSYRTPPL